MGKRQDSIARSDQDAREAYTTTTSSHVDDNLPSTRSRLSRGFPSSSSNPYHPSPSFEADPAPVADFSAAQHRGGSTHEANVPPQSESYAQWYDEGFVDGFCRATFSGAAAQVGPPFVPVAPAVVPGPSIGAGLQPYASSTLLCSLTYSSSNPSHQPLLATGAGPVVYPQAPSWASGHFPQRSGRNRNSAVLPTFQLDPLGVASTSTPQASILPPTPSHSVVIVSQPIPGPPGSQGDRQHVCPRPKCGKSFRRRYLLEDHVSYTHHGIKRHTCPAKGCGNKYVAHTGLMKHVGKRHPGLSVLPPTISVDDVD